MRCGLMKITVRGISFNFDGGTGKTHPPQGLLSVFRPAFSFLPGRRWVWVRIQPQKRDVSKCSVLPGGCQRGKTPHQRLTSTDESDKPLRTAVSRQNGTFRNITVFEAGAENTYTADPRRKEKSRPRTDTTPERTRPCDGSVYPPSPHCLQFTILHYDSSPASAAASPPPQRSP